MLYLSVHFVLFSTHLKPMGLFNFFMQEIAIDLGTAKTIIYFHANAEDICQVHYLLQHLCALLRVNVLAMEYPGYGFYTSVFQKTGS